MKTFPNKEMTGMTHFSLLPSLMCLIGGPGGTGALGGDGGGIWNASSVEAMGCTFSGNFAGKGGGGGGLIPATEAVVPMVVLEVPFATWAC